MNTPFPRIHRIRIRAATLYVVLLLLSGCGRDNGIPRDLTDHLKGRNIVVQPSRTHAPLSQRGGFLVTRYDAQVAANIISTFSLKKLAADDPSWVVTARTMGVTVAVKELWGASGRPAQFKLKDGGQFEYFYLLVTPDGDVYLVVEYAYG